MLDLANSVHSTLLIHVYHAKLGQQDHASGIQRSVGPVLRGLTVNNAVVAEDSSMLQRGITEMSLILSFSRRLANAFTLEGRQQQRC